MVMVCGGGGRTANTRDPIIRTISAMYTSICHVSIYYFTAYCFSLLILLHKFNLHFYILIPPNIVVCHMISSNFFIKIYIN